MQQCLCEYEVLLRTVSFIGVLLRVPRHGEISPCAKEEREKEILLWKKREESQIGLLIWHLDSLSYMLNLIIK